MRKLLPGFFLFLIRLLSFGSLNAQTNSPDLNQVWPQLDAYYRLNEKVQIFMGPFSSTRSNSAYHGRFSRNILLTILHFPGFVIGETKPK